MLSDKFIRILAIWHLHHFYHGILHLPGHLNGTENGILPCLVTVIAKINLRRVPQQLLALLPGKGRPQGCHHVPDTGGIHRNHVHVPLHHQGKARLLNMAVSLVQAKEQLPLVKKDSLP